MARSKITKRVKLSRHRRRHRRNLTRSGGSPRTRTPRQSPSRLSHTTPHHEQEQEQEFLRRLHESELKLYSIKSILNLVSEVPKHSKHVNKILMIVNKSSCGKVSTMSDLIELVRKRGEYVSSGSREIDQKKMNEILGKCMTGLDKLDISVLLKISTDDFFGTCSQRGGGNEKEEEPPRRWKCNYYRPDPSVLAQRRADERAEEPWHLLQFILIIYIYIAGVSMARDYLGYNK